MHFRISQKIWIARVGPYFNIPNTTQHNTTQHNKHNTTQHNTTQCCILLFGSFSIFFYKKTFTKLNYCILVEFVQIYSLFLLFVCGFDVWYHEDKETFRYVFQCESCVDCVSMNIFRFNKNITSSIQNKQRNVRMNKCVDERMGFSVFNVLSVFTAF
jgi:hypothetical protein